MGIRLQRPTRAVIVACGLWLLPRADGTAATIHGVVSVPAGVPTAANAVVYIEQATNFAVTPPAQPLVMDQREYTYRPHVLPLLVGSTVKFPNSDPDAHNTYSVADCCKFNLGTYPRGESRSVTFTNRGIVEILCNIHPQMGAYILVLQDPFFAVTDPAGHYEIPNVPAGDYTLVVWHEVLPTTRQTIHVAGDALEVNLALAAWPAATNNISPTNTMAFVPAGDFIMGSDDRMQNEKPRRTASTRAFWIDRTEVTNAEFCDFLKAFRNNREEGGVKWIDLDNPDCKIHAGKRRGTFVVEPGFEKYPVACVSWYGADAYAQWSGKRLPTETEWEKAARGTDGREWPWGNQFGAGHANASLPDLASKQAKPVGSFPVGVSPFGCYDMAGNVWEWTASEDADSGQKIIRGGAYDSLPSYTRCSVRIASPPELRNARTGFRCAKDATPADITAHSQSTK